MTADALAAAVDYDLRHWIPVPDRYIEAVAEAHGARALAIATLKLMLLVIALAAEKRRRRKSVRELAAHLPTATRNRAWQAQREAQAFWAAWEARGKARRTDAGQAPHKPATSQPAQGPRDGRDPGIGQKRDTSPDTPSKVHDAFSGHAQTQSGHSRKRAVTGTPLTDLEIPRPHPSRQLDPIQQDPVAHPVSAFLPEYLARPLAEAGLRCLSDVSKFSRDGLTGLVPRLARFSSLEAIEGALRSQGLSWSSAGWSPPISSGRTQPLPDLFPPDPEPQPAPEPPAPRSYLTPELIARLDAQTAAVRRMR